MEFKTRDAKTLEADVDKILDGFGSPDYRMTFSVERLVCGNEALPFAQEKPA